MWWRRRKKDEAVAVLGRRVDSQERSEEREGGSECLSKACSRQRTSEDKIWVQESLVA